MKIKLDSIFDSVKDRISNPLIFSFILSWVVYNWRVILALFWLDNKDLSAKGFANHIDYITGTLTTNDVWLWPLLIAILYTFGMPLLKICLELFNAWILKEGNKILFKISEETPVSYSKYLNLMNKIDAEKNKLAKASNEAQANEDKYNKLFEKYNTDTESKQTTINTLNSENATKSQLIDLNEKQIKKQQGDNELLKIKLESVTVPITGIWELYYDDSDVNRFVQFVTSDDYEIEKDYSTLESLGGELMILVDSYRLENKMIIVATPFHNKSKRSYFNIVKNDKESWAGYENDRKIIKMLFVKIVSRRP